MATLGLAIDTTFDDTSVAILRGRNEVLAHLTLSQLEEHAEFGGVVPERASRKHLEVIHALIRQAVREAAVALTDLDWVAVSNRPGLLGSILIGLTVAKALSFALKIPLIGINHIEAHPYACLLAGEDLDFPALHLVVAGGHTLLLLQEGHFDWRVVGRSRDDAAGECADKVARVFGLPMPGGKAIDEIALACQPGDYAFPRPMMAEEHFDFSFSGLKTALKYFHRDMDPNLDTRPVLAAFFQSLCDVLLAKTQRAAVHYQVRTVTVSGGLAASGYLQERFRSATQDVPFRLRLAPRALCTDNAAMVACLAAITFEAGRFDGFDLRAEPNLSV